jgi:uracil-DNA glycosylase
MRNNIGPKSDVRPIHSREDTFLQLVARATGCCACPRMVGRTRVLGPANGNLHAKVLFIAEAPGRRGADVSGIPLHGDQTGRNFDALLRTSGINRDDIFVTNAILCNPRDPAGKNSTPTKQELSNCADHLHVTIDIIQPRYIVTLGTIALQALHSIEAHAIHLSQDVGKCIPWNGRSLIPLYHPGSRARLHRPLQLQVSDFHAIAGLLKR